MATIIPTGVLALLIVPYLNDGDFETEQHVIVGWRDRLDKDGKPDFTMSPMFAGMMPSTNRLCAIYIYWPYTPDSSGGYINVPGAAMSFWGDDAYNEYVKWVEPLLRQDYAEAETDKAFEEEPEAPSFSELGERINGDADTGPQVAGRDWPDDREVERRVLPGDHPTDRVVDTSAPKPVIEGHVSLDTRPYGATMTPGRTRRTQIETDEDAAYLAAIEKAGYTIRAANTRFKKYGSRSAVLADLSKAPASNEDPPLEEAMAPVRDYGDDEDLLG